MNINCTGGESAVVPEWHQKIEVPDMATNSNSEARDRITARVPARVRARLERAASLSGSTVNQFLVQAAVEKAEQLLERERLTVLSERDARQMLELIRNPPTATDKLKRAAQSHRELLSDLPNRAARPKP